MDDFNMLVRECFDISDSATRRTIIALEDNEQNQLLTSYSNKLYDMIVKDVTKIDFGTIPKSKGDITKVDGFANTEKCLSLMRNIVLEYKENPAIVDTVIGAISNIKDNKGLFMKGFALSLEMPIIMYNLMVLCIETSVSFLISVCISYIKDPANNDISVALDKVAYVDAKSNLMFQQLEAFNNACNNKEFERSMREIMKNGGKLAEDAEVPGYPDMEENPLYSQAHNAPAAGGEPEDGSTVIKGSTDLNNVNEALPAALFAVPAIAGKVMAGVGIAAGVAALTLATTKFVIKVVIPSLRNLTYFFMSIPVKLSQTLSIQANFIEANAYKLEYSTSNDLTAEQKAKVIKKQRKIAETMKKWANKFAIDNNKAQQAVAKKIADQNNQMKISDMDNLPENIQSKVALF